MIAPKSSSSSTVPGLPLGRRSESIAGSGEDLRGSSVNRTPVSTRTEFGAARMVSLVSLRGSASGGLGK